MAHRKHFKCRISGCETKPNGSSFCEKHYTQYRRGIIDENGNLLRPLKAIFGNVGCKIQGCDRGHASLGFCGTHYMQLRAGILDKNGNKIRKLIRSHRIGGMDGYDSQKQRGVEFVLNRYFDGGPICRCKTCGRDFEFYQIDGHHPDPSKKTISAQQACYCDLSYNQEVVAELDTLVWVCSHCHIVIHAGGDDVPYTMTQKNQTHAKSMDRQAELLMAEFGRECTDCDRSLGRRTMTFHHKDPSTKIKAISQILGNYKYDFVLSEARKCVVLCDPCHRKRHMVEDGGSSKVKIDWEKRNALIAASPIDKKKVDRPDSCIVNGCFNEHFGLGFCKKHLSQYHAGIIDANGNQLREMYKGGFGKLATMRKLALVAPPSMMPGYTPELNI